MEAIKIILQMGSNQRGVKYFDRVSVSHDEFKILKQYCQYEEQKLTNNRKYSLNHIPEGKCRLHLLIVCDVKKD